MQFSTTSGEPSPTHTSSTKWSVRLLCENNIFLVSAKPLYIYLILAHCPYSFCYTWDAFKQDGDNEQLKHSVERASSL